MDTNKKNEAEDFARYIGEQVRGEAAMRGMSASELSRQMEIDRVTLTRYLTGKRAMPVPVLFLASQVLEVDASTVIARAQERMESDRD